MLSRSESLLRNSTLDSDEEWSVDSEVVRLTGRGRRTGFGGSLLSSDGFFTGLFLFSGAITFGLAVTAGSGLAGEMVLDSIRGRFNPLQRRGVDSLASEG